MVVLGGGAVSYERGTPASLRFHCFAGGQQMSKPLDHGVLPFPRTRPIPYHPTVGSTGLSLKTKGTHLDRGAYMAAVFEVMEVI